MLQQMKLRDRTERVHAFARDNVLLESARQKRSYDHRARSVAVQSWQSSIVVQPHTEEGPLPETSKNLVQTIIGDVADSPCLKRGIV